jgi:predicted alpha/beta-fold hydrolase
MPLKAPRWNLFGDVDDMEQIYWYIKNDLADPDTAMFLHGISSGTALTVTALRKWDKRRKDSPHLASPSFVASMAITPGYDISRVLQPDRFKFPYNDILTLQVKQHFVLQNEKVLRHFDSKAVDATLRANSLQEFVDAAAPFAGYSNATEYYRDGNPINEIRDISTPKFVLNAVDDPCCMIDNLYEQSPYVHHAGKTYAEMIMETSNALVAVTKTGSHCPFLDGFLFPFVRDPLYGGWMLNSWADQVSIEFYRASLEVYGDRR